MKEDLYFLVNWQRCFITAHERLGPNQAACARQAVAVELTGEAINALAWALQTLSDPREHQWAPCLMYTVVKDCFNLADSLFYKALKLIEQSEKDFQLAKDYRNFGYR